MKNTVCTAGAALVISSLTLLASCAVVTPENNKASADSSSVSTPAASGEDANRQIDALAEEIWAWQVEDNLYNRIRLGLPITEFPDITLEAAETKAASARAFLKRVDAVSSEYLSHESEITKRVLSQQLRADVQIPNDYLNYFAITPYMGGFAFTFAIQYLSSVPLQSEQDRRNYLNLLDEFADHIRQVEDKTDLQAQNGIYLPKPALPGARTLLGGLKDNAAAFAPKDDRLKGIDAKIAEKFLASVQQKIESDIIPAYDALLTTIGEDYEDKAPDTVGLSQYPGGAEAYARAVKANTTYDFTIDEIHELGKTRMAAISAEMAAIRNEVGFEGSQADFHKLLFTDERFVAKTPQDVEDRYNDYIARIEPIIGDYFSLLPEAPYGVKRLDPENEPGQTFGYYQVPTANEPRGLYRYNGSNLESRSLIGAGPLIYHELLPGHHFHLALQAENTDLPELRRYAIGITAFNEGWAEYAGSLGYEMGLYDDPWDRYGRLVMSAFLTSRLVVDTGMNALGWSLQDARDYMAEYTMQSELEIASETLRYATDMPGQALAYETGHHNISKFRKRAEEELGDDFDIKAFHAAILGQGALPIDILEWHIDWWIEQEKIE